MDLGTLERRVRNVGAVREIVSTMRALSAVHLRRGSEALAHLREYEETLRRALAALPASVLEPPPPSLVLLLVLGTDQGLCGPLTRRLMDRALTRRDTLAERWAGVIAVGGRTVDLSEAAGCRVIEHHGAPASVRGVDPLVEALAHSIASRVESGRCNGVEVVYTRHEGAGVGAPTLTRVFPVHRRQLLAGGEETPSQPPRTYMEASHIAQSLLEEWTYVEVYRAAMESLTAEHAARLRTTDAATHALDRRLEELRLERNHLTQEAITEELRELGAAARGRRA